MVTFDKRGGAATKQETHTKARRRAKKTQLLVKRRRGTTDGHGFHGYGLGEPVLLKMTIYETDFEKSQPPVIRPRPLPGMIESGE
jgi:hypothetical protein